ncbi:MAG: tyrosine-type recombinase/integrase [Opitutaceae bacterium]
MKLTYKYKSSEFRHDDPAGRKNALAMARPLSEEARAAREIAPAARWESWVDEWLALKHRDCARTLQCETLRWTWVHAFLEERQIAGPQGVTYQLALDYLKWRTSQTKRVSKKHPSHNTALAEVRFLSRVMREAVHRGFVLASPLERLGIKRDRPPEKDEMTDQDIATIRAALAKREGHLPLQDQWMTICFEVAIHQGCRLRETSLPLDDIDLTHSQIMFHAKRNKVFTTLLHDGLRDLIQRLKATGADRTCTLPKMVSKQWHWFFKGRPERNWSGVCPHVCFHCTRVTVITRMARAGVPIQQAMAYVGHANALIHRIYQRLAPKDLKLCTEALSFGGTNATRRNQDAA